MQSPEPPRQTPWVALSASLSFLVRSKTLLGWSLGLTMMTVVLTWVGFLVTTGLLDSLTGSFLSGEPARNTWFGWLKYSGWLIATYLFLFVSRIISFFIAFLFAYTLSSPFYSFLSAAAERRFLGSAYTDDDGFTVRGVGKDLVEGFKIAAFGLLVTIGALAIGFIPLFGQLAVVFLYACYATLMFIDYPASRRRWGLGRKLLWLRRHLAPTLRLGIFPALIGMIPVVNIVLMALFFPLLTVHATLNFSAIERGSGNSDRQPSV